MNNPTINITIPVFNRYELTQLTLLSLRKCSQVIPFTVTVVDNGSDSRLVNKLVEFKKSGIIDKLFLLEENMGISCAANIGWEMTDAPFYMKLDNDILIKDADFFKKIFEIWKDGDPLSTLGPFLRAPATYHPVVGNMGICSTNLPGAAILIPKQVSDILGFWSEDYGLYGAEDGDYGARMDCMGFPQYYYPAWNLLKHLGYDSDTEYIPRGLDKCSEHSALFKDETGNIGLFVINYTMYNLCIRTWKPVRRFLVDDIDANGRVHLKENKAFFPYKAALDQCAEKIIMAYTKTDAQKRDFIFTDQFIEELKEILRPGGYDCSSMARADPEFIHHSGSDIP